MRPNQMIVRCFAYRSEGLWVAFCVDFNLACQADSLSEARSKLDMQIKEYLFDALEGEDQAYAAHMLSRRAPAGIFAMYWVARAANAVFGLLHRKTPRRAQPFNEVIPLTVAHC